MKNKVTKEDLKGEIKDFPIEVVQRMCEYQDVFDPSIFARFKCAAYRDGGFSLILAKEGSYFWHEVIENENFDLFFERYPKQEENMKTKVTKDDLKGHIENFPIEVVQQMCEYQVKQKNKFNPSVFAYDKMNDVNSGGFRWIETDEGHLFWEDVIAHEDFDVFFKKYPKQKVEKTTDTKIEDMKTNVTKEDLQGAIEDYPIEVIQRMCECQVEQGNKFDPSIFANDIMANRFKKGFSWDRTDEDGLFWDDIIDKKRFDLFFEKYPKKEQKQETNMKAELKIPEGFEFDCVENGVIKLKAIKKEFPKTWEECIEVGKTYYYINTISAIKDEKITEDRYLPVNRNLMTSYKTAEAMRAFIMLITARDAYRNGWVPDWSNDERKYCISSRMNKIEIGNYTYYSEPISFQSREVRDAFFENFKDLLEEAKELL
ncbi:MAG: hypothetical protein ACRCZB_02915 [Bacteroidales bacterium]